jgi:hypothetical protein
MKLPIQWSCVSRMRRKAHVRFLGGREAERLPSYPPLRKARPPTPCLTLPPAFGLLIIGDEILSGKRADKHLPKVAQMLALRGLSLAWGALCGRRPRAHHRGLCAKPLPATRWCFAVAVSAPHPMITHANVRPAPSVWGLNCIPRPSELIRERMQEVALEQGQGVRSQSPRQPSPPTTWAFFQSGLRSDPESLQQNTWIQLHRCWRSGRVYFMPGFPCHGLAHDGVGPRRATTQHCFNRAPAAGAFDHCVWWAGSVVDSTHGNGSSSSIRRFKCLQSTERGSPSARSPYRIGRKRPGRRGGPAAWEDCSRNGLHSKLVRIAAPNWCDLRPEPVA